MHNSTQQHQQRSPISNTPAKFFKHNSNKEPQQQNLVHDKSEKHTRPKSSLEWYSSDVY